MRVDTLLEAGTGLYNKESINEDTLFVKGNLFGVFDGATGLNKYKDEKGNTGGYLAASIAKSIFEQKKGSLVDLTVQANKAIADEMKSRNVDVSKKYYRWTASAAVVRINKDSFDWIQIGDSIILLIDKSNNYRLLVENYNHDIGTLTMWHALAKKKVKNIRAELKQQIIKVRNRMNVDYGSIDGEEEMLNFLNKGTEALNKIKMILLFTDGLLLPQENPREKDDFKQLVDLYLDGGLIGIKDYVRDLERTDPNCWKFIRLKQHDDIAAIAITIK